jgi:hypothetical protein
VKKVSWNAAVSMYKQWPRLTLRGISDEQHREIVKILHERTSGWYSYIDFGDSRGGKTIMMKFEQGNDALILRMAYTGEWSET